VTPQQNPAGQHGQQVLRPTASFSRIQKHATKADHRRANKLGLSNAKLSGGSTHPTVPDQIIEFVRELTEWPAYSDRGSWLADPERTSRAQFLIQLDLDAIAAPQSCFVTSKSITGP
jgi:hypothetical protein